MPATRFLRRLSKRLEPGDTVERCGVVLSGDRIREVPNTHPQPERGFRIPVKHMKTATATWHTHPGATAHFSQDDYVGFSQWPDMLHYIVGIDGVRAYKVAEHGLIVEVPLAD